MPTMDMSVEVAAIWTAMTIDNGNSVMTEYLAKSKYTMLLIVHCNSVLKMLKCEVFRTLECIEHLLNVYYYKLFLDLCLALRVGKRRKHFLWLREANWKIIMPVTTHSNLLISCLPPTVYIHSPENGVTTGFHNWGALLVLAIALVMEVLLNGIIHFKLFWIVPSPVPIAGEIK